MKYAVSFILFLSFLILPTHADEAPPAEAFARLPTFQSIKISPDGRKFSALVNQNNRYQFSVFENTEPLALLYNMSEDDKFEIRKVFWPNNNRLVFSIEYSSKRYGTETTETRLLSMNADGTDIRGLYRIKADDAYIPQFQDQIVSLLPDSPNEILVQYGENQAVYKIQVDRTGRHKTVQKPRKDITHWRADVHGNVRIGTGVINNKKRKLIVKRKDAKWHNISHRVTEESGTFYIDGISDDPDIFYVLSNHESDTDALYTYNVETNEFLEQIYSNEQYDISGTYQDRKTGKALGVYFADDDSKIVWLEDSIVRKHLNALKKYFTGKSVSIRNVNQTTQWATVYVDQGNAPGSYHLYNMKNAQLAELGAQHPDLEGVALGQTIATTYTARDGLEIPAYVTLPPGIETLADAKNIPFVIHPHGGPNARDLLGFDYWVQFFATRGYGVLQMNFRGSAGYGNEFSSAGDRQWGQAMQDDITDGTKWLIDNGHADKDRLAILGASYGGYAALMGAVKTPELYQCAVSFGGVTDLPKLLYDAKQYVNGKYRTRHIGNLWKDRSMLKDNSPAKRAADIQIPILLIHGEKDRVVDRIQAKIMRKALKKAGKDYTYFELPNGDHYLSLYANRLKFLQETEKFLAGCIGE